MSPRRVPGRPRGFQRATAAALETLRRTDGPRRFLVADEVGLGKTVVARTVIKDLMAGRRQPLVVFYLSSNLNIAHQNRAKLLDILPTEHERHAALARADRLTLAADQRKRPTHARLHLHAPAPSLPSPARTNQIRDAAILQSARTPWYQRANARLFRGLEQPGK